MIEFKDILVKNSEDIAITAISSHDGVSEKNITFADLNVLINKLNYIFKENNLSVGDDLLILLPNSLEMAIVYLASINYGLNFIPLPCEVNKNDIERIFKITNPKLCIIADLIYPKLKDFIAAQCLNIQINNEFDWLKDKELSISESRVSKTYISTSGTTGEPKLMIIDNNKLLASGEAFLKHHNLDNSKLRFWNYLPMSYLGGLFNLLIIPLISGGSSVITKTFNGQTFLSFWQTVERFDINALWFTPSITKGLCMFGKRIKEDLRKKYTRNIQVSFIGMAPISLKDKQNFENMFDLTLLENFALSETTFFTSETKSSLNQRLENSVGEILPYTDVKFEKISDDISEIKVKTPFLFDGYLSENGKVELNVDEEGYFSTKDLGYLKNNSLVIQGRNRDIIKKGGYFIQLREIELIAETNPLIKEACAVKIPHDFYGESYNFYIIITEPSKSNDFREWLFNNLVKYKWPENIILKSEFPKTSSGKIKKELLNE